MSFTLLSRPTLLRALLAALLLLPFVLHIQGRYPLALLDRLDLLSYDLRVQSTLLNSQDPRIVIVDIDEYSLGKEGQWPWSRDKIAQLINQLFDDYGVRTLGLDVVFAEPDRASPRQILEKLQQSSQSEQLSSLLAIDSHDWDNDEKLAQAILQHDVVLGYTFKPKIYGDEPAAIGKLPPPIISAAQLKNVTAPFVEAQGFTSNIPQLADATVYGGFFENALMDSDGSIRRVPLVQKYQGALYPSLALATARMSLGNPPVALAFDNPEKKSFSGIDLEYLAVGDHVVAVDDRGGVLVPYRGRQGSFPYIPAAKVLDGTADIGSLFDTTVLLGSSAPGLLDLRATPVGNQYSGVEVHANIISGIFDQRFYHKPAYTVGIELVILGLIATLLVLLMPKFGPRGKMLLLGIIIALIIFGAAREWLVDELVFPLSNPLAYAITLFILLLVPEYFLENKKRLKLSKVFSQYVPSALVDKAENTTEETTVTGEMRDMTVLFADVSNFSSLAERLSPDDLSSRMNELWSPISRAINNSSGTIDKYMGDAVMAFWGAPNDDPQHADHAISCALDIVKIIAELSQKFEGKGWPALQISIGINSGLMHVGNMGSEQRLAYTVLGDAVNLAARFEKLCSQYHVDILIGEGCRQRITEHKLKYVDTIIVKGRDEPSNIYRIDDIIVADADEQHPQKNLSFFD